MARRSSPPAPDRTGPVRCALYTRKSSEEGLEQAFNSLDAQRETCEAYVLSQKHEGWVALPTLYDDGGVSGGTLERPALRRLLADIAAGRVDTVVVYKVDRLTRSLTDFARIVDVFEAHRVTFVSVTQSFNTTTSMGRLTLNMLLSFAQFEREVAGERIRDKIAASKRKGLWMGGLPPLGYDVADRALVVNAAEAEIVRHIFGRYGALGSVRRLKDELDAAGIVSKRRTDRFGRENGGRPLARGALYLMLQNPIYRGLIVHKGQSYPGAHPAIIDEPMWAAVQAKLSANRVERKAATGASAPSLLAGLVHDETGEPMTPTHANKGGTRYRYYVSQSLIRPGRPGARHAGRRLPAGELEALVEARIGAFLADPSSLFESLDPVAGDALQRTAMVEAASTLSRQWPQRTLPDRRMMVHRLVARIDVGRDHVAITVRPATLATFLMPTVAMSDHGPGDRTDPIVLRAPIHLRRAGQEVRLRIEGPCDGRRPPDRSLLRLLAQANRFRTMVMTGTDTPIATLAGTAGVSPSYFSRILKLAFLSPTIVATILDGRQPERLSATVLSRAASRLPADWSRQAQQLGLED